MTKREKSVNQFAHLLIRVVKDYKTQSDTFHTIMTITDTVTKISKQQHNLKEIHN